VYLWRHLILPGFIGCVVVVAYVLVWEWRSRSRPDGVRDMTRY
jgi:hypothetical protein